MGLSLALTVDLLLSQRLLRDVTAVLTVGDLEVRLCGLTCDAWTSIYVWIGAAATMITYEVFRTEDFRTAFTQLSHLSARRSGYSIVPDGRAAASQSESNDPRSFKGQTLAYSALDTTNYIDPIQIQRLYPNLQAEGITELAENMALVLGFQVDSSTNQVEHLVMLMINEIRPESDQPIDWQRTREVAAKKIHSRMFQNYLKWCDRMGIESNLLNSEYSYFAYIEDILLFLHVWGEAANLRHLPECLCFLFHKTMEMYQRCRVNPVASENEIYYGYFLDTVVRPLYEEILAASRLRVDHVDRKIYDDFNEFFWNPDCLQYKIFPVKDGDSLELARALRAAPKTYLEKRSWFHPLYSMNRLFEWHAISFTLLAAIAFSNLLQWTWFFTLKVASIVFLEMSAFGILWTCLELWTLNVKVGIPFPSLCGYLLRIVAGYMVLTYQTIYFHWAFVDSSNSPLTRIAMFTLGDDIFWWWQYIWLSLMASVLYFSQTILTLFPSVVSALLTTKSDLVQAFLSVWYPNSQLFVGKDTSLPSRYVWMSVLFWVSLLTFKLWFGYYYVVSPVAVPTLELYDDYMNYEKVSFLETSTMMFLWWFPHFLVFIIDLSIWYAVWSSVVGGFVAMYDRLGAVRDSETFRGHFYRANGILFDTLMPTKLSADKKLPPRHVSKSRDNLRDFESMGQHESATPTAGSTAAGDVEQGPTPKSSFIKFAERKWTVFARIWNEIVTKLRTRDLLNDQEQMHLSFTSYETNFAQVAYLPLFQTVGRVRDLLNALQEMLERQDSIGDKGKKLELAEDFFKGPDETAVEAVKEAWELFAKIMDSMLAVDVASDAHDDRSKNIFHRFDELREVHKSLLLEVLGRTALPKIVQSAGKIARELKAHLAKRKTKPVVVPASSDIHTSVSSTNTAAMGTEGSLRKSLSSGYLQNLEKEKKNKQFRNQLFARGTEINDTLRDALREELKKCINAVKEANELAPPNLKRSLDDFVVFLQKKTHSFNTYDESATMRLNQLSHFSNIPTMVAKLDGLLNLRATDMELRSSEASRRLNFFLSSVYMYMPEVPESRFCKGFTVMTPYYSEDILLTKENLLTANSDKITVLLYLQTLFRDEWENFLERLGIKEADIWSSKNILQTRMWASCRAQTLFRTVEGMMYNEDAIRLLAELETSDGDDGRPRYRKEEIDFFCKTKFNYVVACQAYGDFKKTQNSKAEDIEFLMERFPNIRVAFIDRHKVSAERTDFYSVLVKYEPPDATLGTHAGSTSLNNTDKRVSPIREVYRVKLPGDPIVGEGKPENQNHAIIFSRGRYLQAIDMNQDGYFEESLKMRNLLEEFENEDCAIVGFREHIFTGSVSSVANYMALQELSFVTLGQRVLNRPLKIRQHYGHPDLFDKLFVMTEGGMSKASKGINLSEDVFAGFNATIRGHMVNFVEYVQCGKGRDVGLQQTYKFEAKLSQGNAEQSISRDVSRIGNRLDFFRLLSFYYGGIGHYLSNTLVMFTLVVVIYTMLAFAVYGTEGVDGRPIHPEGVLQILLAGMGILQTMPLFVTLTVEKGFLSAVNDIFWMIVSGGPLYFIFHIQTKCYYFSQTLLAGNAQYRPTGRTFVTYHSRFEDNYRFFASSHIYLGFELTVALVLFGCYTESTQYFGLTWSLWLAAVSFLLGPFWFNPLSFDWERVYEDFVTWYRWMMGKGASAELSWEMWWKEEVAFYKRLSVTWKIFLFLQKVVVWFVIANGLFGGFLYQWAEEKHFSYVLLLLILLFLGTPYLRSSIISDDPQYSSLTYFWRRTISLVWTSSLLSGLIYLLLVHPRNLLSCIALYYLMAAICFLGLLLGYSDHKIIRDLYFTHDIVVGAFLFALLSLLSLLKVQRLQTWLLYHNALSQKVAMDSILEVARTGGNNIDDLKKKIEEQERHIARLEKDLHHHHFADNLNHASHTSSATTPTSATNGHAPLDAAILSLHPVAAHPSAHAVAGAKLSTSPLASAAFNLGASPKNTSNSTIHPTSTNNSSNNLTLATSQSASNLTVASTDFTFSQPRNKPRRDD